MVTAEQVMDFTNRVNNWGCLSTEEQENVISFSLERLWKKERHQEIQKPTRWLLAAARRIKHEVLRRRRQDVQEFSAICEPRVPDRHFNGRPVACEDKPEASEFDDFIDQVERAAACQAALESLTSVERQVVELCIEGIKPAEAGRILSIGRSTTKSHWDRARQKLRTEPTLDKFVSRWRKRAK